MSIELQNIVDDLAKVNTLVAHTATELHTKVSALVDTVEGQAKEDLAAVLDMVATIRTAAHSTLTLASKPDLAALAAPVLNPPVDLAALANAASAAEDEANGVEVAPAEAEVEPALTDVAPVAPEVATTDGDDAAKAPRTRR